MSLFKPYKLNYGDKIAITAPAYYDSNPEQTQRGIRTLQELGFNVVIGKSVTSKYGNTTGTADFKIKELEMFFEDSTVKAIICLIGGDAAFQLLKDFNYKVVEKNPKIITGMSDITHLLYAFTSQSNITCLHGPDLFWGFGLDEVEAKKYNIELFLKCCMNPEPLGEIPHFSNWETWHDGVAEGKLLGGWFEATTKMKNGKYYPKFKQYIWFVEFVDIEPHDVARDLEIMDAEGFFENVCAILVGQEIECEEKTYDSEEVPTIKQQIQRIANQYNLPVLANVDFGHGDTNIPLPEGVLAKIDATNKKLTILESYVVDSD